MVGGVCVGLRWKICPVDEDWEPFVYELWIKAHSSVFCSGLQQLTWLPNNCLERKRKREYQRGRLAEILQDCTSFGFGKVRSLGIRKIQRQNKSNCEHPNHLFSSGTLNPKLENGYFLWRTGISRMEPYSPPLMFWYLSLENVFCHEE